MKDTGIPINEFIDYIIDTNTLKPCPMCGEQATIGYHSDSYGVTYTVRCKNCYCTNNKCTASTVESTHVEAIKKIIYNWNNRYCAPVHSYCLIFSFLQSIKIFEKNKIF